MTFKTKAVISTGANHFDTIEDYISFVSAVPACVQADALNTTYKNEGKVISSSVERDANTGNVVLLKEWDSSTSARSYNDSTEVEALRSFQRSMGWEVVSWEVLPS